ncbi:protein kinase [Sorangium sp. So ce136]|uniref:protein kinase domain-containing protein n=1 Tax=Sorangium sp. So ce136 TaxID=3133284 RepID=UPI003F0EB94E
MELSGAGAAEAPDRDPGRAGAPKSTRRRVLTEADRYTFHEVIGQGGLGRVLRARDHVMDCDVATKMLHQVGPDQLYRLKREFRLLAGIAHPNLIELYELVADGERCFFTMELLDGVTFLEHVRGHGGEGPGPHDPERLRRIREALGQLAAGLDALHTASRLHCDLKPANLASRGAQARAARRESLDGGTCCAVRRSARPSTACSSSWSSTHPTSMRS